jgi:hypothetical protein
MAKDIDRIESIFVNSIETLNEWGGRWVDRVGPSTPAKPALPSDLGRTTDIFEYFCLLQVEHRMPGRTGSSQLELAEKAATIVEDYFFGEWRATFPKQDKLRREWFEELRIGMLSGLLLPDRRLFNCIIQFPTSDLDHDEGGWDRTRSDNQVYISLCESLRQNNGWHAPEIKGKRPTAMEQLIQSILVHDDRAFQKGFSSYLSWYRKKEHEDRGNMLISLDGSILLLVATMHGLNVEHFQQQDPELLLVPHTQRI